MRQYNDAKVRNVMTKALPEDPARLGDTLDVAIVGGGLCGLALAHSLHARHLDWAVFEARDRLGGRVFTTSSAQGLALDLGPAWYWPATQPSITRLVDDLVLPWFDQADDGRVLWLDDPNRAPRTLAVDALGRPAEGATAAPGALHGGARRLAAGMQSLVDALVSRLPAARLRRGWALQQLQDAGDHVVLHLREPSEAGASRQVRARRVVLALPPRVAEDGITFDPALPGGVQGALRATPTWMATAAKSAVAFAEPFWRAQGHSGNACVTHPQAVLAEVFDIGPPSEAGTGAALGGFVALGAAARQAIAPRSMKLLIDSQLTMLFGPAAGDGELCIQDWATERWTCSPADLGAEQAGEQAGPDHPPPATGPLTMVHWGGRLLFGGSETAARSAGYLEGALNAAARLRRQLTEVQSAVVGLGA
jgi:monoamine oxidase